MLNAKSLILLGNRALKALLRLLCKCFLNACNRVLKPPEGEGRMTKGARMTENV